MNEKLKVARLSVISNAILTIGKLSAGIHMNSISVISDALHSGIDLMAGLITFFSVRASSKPADDHHRYGHGKFENIASIVEALLIILAAALIIYNAVPRIVRGAEIHSLGLGAAVIAISATVNYFVSREVMRVAKKTESPALAANAWHLRTDVYTSLGVLAGIIGIRLTGLTVLDPLVAVGIALLIVKAAYKLIVDSMRSILDVSLPEKEEKVIKEVLNKYADQFLEFHKLRTRKAGSQRYLDLHLVVPREWAINKVHSLCDQIENEIKDKFTTGIQIIIHCEPCHRHCNNCSQNLTDKTPGSECKPDCANKVQCNR